MRIRTALTAVTAALALVLLATGCKAQTQEAPAADAGQDEAPAATESADEFTSTAMVVTLSDGQVLFVDQDTETPYYPTLPEGTPELAAGNIVRVTGNGIMLESYPAQYPGITDVEVVEEGAPADAEKYDELVAQIWQPKDPSEPPYASVEYTTDLASVSLMPVTCGYTWTYDQDGSEQTVSVDAPHPTQLEVDSLPDVRVDGPTEVTVSFDVKTTGLVVSRWSEGALDVEGEPVEVESGTFIVEPGYRYAFFATFYAGHATYAFTVR